MVIAFSGGGTLGHIYPALSIIKEMKTKYPKIRIIFITTIKDKKYLEQINIQIDKIYYIDASGFSKNLFKLGKGVIKNIISISKIKNILIKEEVDVVVGMGGYISTLSIYAGLRLKKKTIIHEQNSIMGLGNKLVIKYVDLVMTSFKIENIKNKNNVVVVNPRYYDALNTSDNIYKNKYNILITSGTLGSETINKLAINFLNSDDSKKYTTTLITGVRYYKDVLKKIKKGDHYQVLAFTNNMLDLMGRSGIIISRSGATTIFEILGSGLVPIYIPSPNVTKNHQYFNSEYFVHKNLGEMIEEQYLNVESFNNILNKVVSNYENYITNINQYRKNIVRYDVVEIIIKVGNNSG